MDSSRCCPPELHAGGLQVSMAHLWKDPYVCGGNQAARAHNAPGVSLTRTCTTCPLPDKLH